MGDDTLSTSLNILDQQGAVASIAAPQQPVSLLQQPASVRHNAQLPSSSVTTEVASQQSAPRLNAHVLPEASTFHQQFALAAQLHTQKLGQHTVPAKQSVQALQNPTYTPQLPHTGLPTPKLPPQSQHAPPLQQQAPPLPQSQPAPSSNAPVQLAQNALPLIPPYSMPISYPRGQPAPPANPQAQGKGKGKSKAARQPTFEFIMVDPSQKSQSNRLTRRTSTITQAPVNTPSAITVNSPGHDTTSPSTSTSTQQPQSSGRAKTTKTHTQPAPYVKPSAPPAYVPPPSSRAAGKAASRGKCTASLSTNARKEVLSYVKTMENTADSEAIIRFLNLADDGIVADGDDELVSRWLSSSISSVVMPHMVQAMDLDQQDDAPTHPLDRGQRVQNEHQVV